jgi:hypothetical protein
MPAMPMSVNVSENNNQASIAVSGGVKYIKLETWVAALLRIRAYNKNMAPIDNANIDILLKNIKSSKVRFLACSNNNNEFNKDVVVGQHRNVNLTIKPFYMKEIFHTFSEGVDGCSINIYKIS